MLERSGQGRGANLGRIRRMRSAKETNHQLRPCDSKKGIVGSLGRVRRNYGCLSERTGTAFLPGRHGVVFSIKTTIKKTTKVNILICSWRPKKQGRSVGGAAAGCHSYIQEGSLLP